MEGEELIFGRNPVYEYLRSAKHGENIEIYIARSAHGKIVDEIKQSAEEKKIPVQLKDRQFFTSLGPSSRHQGVVLKASSSIHDRNLTANILLSQTAQSKGVLVLLDQITDPHNVGSIIRTAEALGCEGIVLPKSHAPALTPGVVKASAGATAHIDTLFIGNIAAFLDEAKAAGLWIVGTAGEGSIDLDEIENIRPCVVVIGSEDKGIRRLTAEKCDYLVRIPLSGKISSLNASVAAGIVLYEMTRKPKSASSGQGEN